MEADFVWESADEWGESDVSKNIGVSIKYGITSSITAETTVNPDFSQVESDAFQVEVNRRYPVFYSEKRPFFMEGMDIFDFEPFLGTGHQIRFGFTFQPIIRLNLNFEFVHNELYRKADSQKSYAVDIVNLHTTYQFNKYFFIRGVVGYDDFQKKLLTGFLASFTLIPGTVVHLGYGSLYEGRTWQNNQWVPYQDDLLNVKNSLFVKVSYLWRIK